MSVMCSREKYQKSLSVKIFIVIVITIHGALLILILGVIITESKTTILF